jgi:hypothetical protein
MLRRDAKTSAMRRALLLLVLLLLVTEATAEAFSGFYVAGTDAKLASDATVVVLMRDGTRTVVSLQSHYVGPPEAFAIVLPVPVVLPRENVKTLDAKLFERLDRLTAPRLVELWEVDPCVAHPPANQPPGDTPPADAPQSTTPKSSADEKVKVEAELDAGEYEIVVLSASDSAALDAWLVGHHYALPAGAEAALRPYVAEGMKFFVARVDPKKVAMKDGKAMLSPLRFHYDDEKLRLPVRLGLLSSPGTQDLVVHVIARDRFEAANHPNVTMATNLDVDAAVRADFGAFYAALFDKTLAKHPGAVVTEYAWEAASCDPCTEPPLTPPELLTLGGDVLEGMTADRVVLTRLHARYGKDALGEDLVFRTAEPIAGGREARDAEGEVEKGSRPAATNAFQARYAIRNGFRGRMICPKPIRGRWGGPPGGKAPPSATPAVNVAFAPRGGTDLAALLRQDVPDLDITIPKRGRAQSAPASSAPPPTASAPSSRSCSCAFGGAPAAPLAFALALAFALLLRRGNPDSGRCTP